MKHVEYTMSQNEVRQIALDCGYTASILNESCPEYDMNHEQYWFLSSFYDGHQEQWQDHLREIDFINSIGE